jgi:hypothetical protein
MVESEFNSTTPTTTQSGQTRMSYLNDVASYDYQIGQSYRAASGSGNTTTMGWSGMGSLSGTYAWGEASIGLNPAVTAVSETVSNAVAAFSNNCTTSNGGASICNDASSVLSVNQQYNGATGNVFQVQNAGTGMALAIQNGSGVNAFSVDTAGGKITIGAGAAGEANPDILVLDSGTTANDPTEVNGAMYYNSSMRSFRCGSDGNWQSCEGAIQAYTATVGPFSNDTSEHTLGQTFTVPQNDCQPGVVYHIVAAGHAPNGTAGSSVTFNFQDKNVTAGTTTDLFNSAIKVGTDSAWNIDLYVTCRSTTSVYASGDAFSQYNAGGNAGNFSPFVNNSGSTISNSAAGDQFGFSITWSAAPGAGNGVYEHTFDVQRLGPP